MAYDLLVTVRIPVATTFHNDNGDLVIRAEVRLPADSWKRPHYPTDRQIEAAIALAFGNLKIEGSE